MHRVVGDRTRALVGALTVAGLCWDLTSFATTRVEVARYHGGHRDGPCVRCRAARFAHATLTARSLQCTHSALPRVDRHSASVPVNPG